MRRILKYASISIASIVALVVLVGLPLYVFPPVDDDINGAQLAYVIGPATNGRIALAKELLENGTVDEILISVAGGGPLGAEEIDACDEPFVTCEHPNPFTTKGEVDALADFAEANDIDKTIVLTFAPHVQRSRFIFDKCFSGDVTVMTAPQSMTFGDWVYQYAYQSAAFAKAWLRPCATSD
jgi:hypothetical protein